MACKENAKTRAIQGEHSFFDVDRVIDFEPPVRTVKISDGTKVNRLYAV
jgi:hypothetical protein